ncbi:hypothetical protein [Halomicronema hongdechloris]|nr:hypothetical protein [Halomicronema hongdechloris]
MADQLSCRFAPGKVLIPDLLSGIEERHSFAGERIRVGSPGELVTVTAKTSPSQVFQGGCAAKLTGLDVIDGETIGREGFWAAAVFTTLLGSLSNLSPPAETKSPFALFTHSCVSGFM